MGAPRGWIQRFNEMWKTWHDAKLSRFMHDQLNQVEQESERYFNGVCNMCTSFLGIQDVVDTRDHTKLICGGYLADAKYDYISYSDKSFKFDVWKFVIGSEAKRNEKFPPGTKWYSGCKAVQVFATLYSMNCPVFNSVIADILVYARAFQSFLGERRAKCRLHLPLRKYWFEPPQIMLY